MKSKIWISGFRKTLCVFLTMSLMLLSGQLRCEDNTVATEPDEQAIMLALLLDTSNSMDGLIDQAKSQLWKIVNELSMAKCYDGRKPRIKIALYEYGNDALPSSEGYIRMVNPLTTDLDLISEKLFSLTTNGGNEFCGQVMKTSLDQLDWSKQNDDLKLIFIAGNEPFTQGPVSYIEAAGLAKEKGVIVNTIFCGDFQEGIRTGWKNGATLTGGNYMAIEQNQQTVYVITPYDPKIDALNEQLNKTYLYYGLEGKSKKEAQATQDKNAESYGQANKVERAISKSSHAYENSTWDLVDAAKNNDKVLSQAKPEQLPKEMQGMTTEERKKYVQEKSAERQRIQKEIQKLSTQRQQYIQENSPKDASNMLDAAMINAIKTQAKAKKLNW
jgi:hypothetical protein